MDDLYAVALHPSNAWYPRNRHSKSNDLHNLSSAVLASVVAFARKENLSKQAFEQELEDTKSIFEGLVSSFAPYKENNDDEDAFWQHTYVPENVLSSKFKTVGTFNNSYESYVTDYIATPSMHTEALTRRLIDAYLYEDLISAIHSYKQAYNALKDKNPNLPLFINDSKYPWLRLALIFIKGLLPYIAGYYIYQFDVELLVPFIMVVIFYYYSSITDKKLITEGAVTIYKHTIRTYRRYAYYPAYSYNANALYADIFFNCPDIYFPNNLYDLIDLIKK